jgi:FMN phosphatase YigB (HAD superfamily)
VGAEKPDPACFAAMAQQLQLKPQQLAMVGDHPYRDVLGALRAGFGRAFWLSHSHGLRLFSPEIAETLIGSQASVTQIQHVRELLWYFPSSSPPRQAA